MMGDGGALTLRALSEILEQRGCLLLDRDEAVAELLHELLGVLERDEVPEHHRHDQTPGQEQRHPTPRDVFRLAGAEAQHEHQDHARTVHQNQLVSPLARLLEELCKRRPSHHIHIHTRLLEDTSIATKTTFVNHSILIDRRHFPW